MADPSDAVRTYLTSEHAELLERTAACADAVVEHWKEAGQHRNESAAQNGPDPATSTRDDIVGPLRACLERAGVHERLPAVLAGAVDAAEYSLHGQPVAAPPYIVVTSRGPVLRGTTDHGRLVITLCVFEVQRRDTDTETQYMRTDEPLVIDVETK